MLHKLREISTKEVEGNRSSVYEYLSTCKCDEGTFVWDYEKDGWSNCTSCNLPDE